MIVCVLDDGTRRVLDKAIVKLTWVEPDEEEGTEREREFDLSNVKALLLLGPDLGIMPGNFEGTEVLGIRFKLKGMPSIETPMPLDYAADLGAALVDAADEKGVMPSNSSIRIARVMPTDPPKHIH